MSFAIHPTESCCAVAGVTMYIVPMRDAYSIISAWHSIAWWHVTFVDVIPVFSICIENYGVTTILY